MELIMPEYISTKEAAERLGISPRRLLQLIKTNRLPAIKPGHDWLVNPDDLEKVKHRPTGYPAGKPRTGN
jgi:excisionase family DNA binding protein